MVPPTPSAWKHLLPLLVLTLIHAVGLALLACGGKVASDETSLLWKVLFALFVVRWVGQDRRLRDLRTPFEFSAFVFFAWIVVLPYYLYKTRGLRGLLNTLGFWLLAAVPDTTAEMIRLSGAHW